MSNDAASLGQALKPTNSADQKLAELGYNAELRRQYSPFALIAIAVITCNSWGAVGGALITGTYGLLGFEPRRRLSRAMC